MGGIPIPGEAWPSAEWAFAFQQYAVNDARYTGDQEALHSLYAGQGGTSNRGDDPRYHYNNREAARPGVRGLFSRWRWRFFSGRETPPDEARTQFIAPAAYNLANLSSDLLTAEPPTFRIVDGEGKAVKSPAQDRLDKVLNGKASQRTIAHAAELAAGLGAVALTAHWDTSKSDRPWLDFTVCDAVIPEFVGGRLDAVNLFTVHFDYSALGIVKNAFMHVERHEPGAIIHAVYKLEVSQANWEANGFAFRKVGEVIPIPSPNLPDDLNRLALIPGSVAGPIEGTIALPTGIKQLTASWWRNRPTRLFRKYAGLSMLGRADFEGEGEVILDGIDMVWSSWLRDIKLAKARLIVPEAFLDLQGGAAAFDEEREILQKLNYVSLKDGETIDAQQFAIRAAEHQATLTALTRELTQFAGYSMSTYGDEAGASKTATEVVDRTTLTERTRDKKALYMFEALEPIARALMELDRVHYRQPGLKVSDELDIEIPDLSQIDPEKEARTLQYLRAAQAISVRTMVDAQHPEWDQQEKDSEVERILAEFGLSEEQIEVQDPGALDRTDPNGQPLDENGQPVEMPQVADGSAGGDNGTGNSVTPGSEQPALPAGGRGN